MVGTIIWCKILLSKLPDTLNPLPLGGKQRIQEVVGVLLYHAQVLNWPALDSLTEICTAQANPTEYTLDATTRLLNYCATYPNPIFRVVASDMILRVFSDASYLPVSNCQSRVADYFYLSGGMPADSDTSTVKPFTTTKLTPNNDPSPP